MSEQSELPPIEVNVPPPPEVGVAWDAFLERMKLSPRVPYSSTMLWLMTAFVSGWNASQKPMTDHPSSPVDPVAEIRARRSKLSVDHLCVDDHIVREGDTPGEFHVFDTYEDDPPLVTNFATADDAAFFAHAPQDIDTLLARVDQQAKELAGKDARIAGLEGALTELRDWFAYGQYEHTGMNAVATPRCSPSAWKEIRHRVDAALAASADAAQEPK